MSDLIITWKNPWVELVQVNFGNDWKREMVASDLAAQILNEKLLVGGVKPKTRRQTQLGKRVFLWNSHFFKNTISIFKEEGARKNEQNHR